MSAHRTAPEPAKLAVWFKSSHSDEEGGNCVEIANLIPTHARVAVRDSKVPNGPVLAVQPEAFSAFVDHVRG